MLLFWATVVDAAAFVLVGCVLRGFAYEGRIADGRYYLSATRGRAAHEKEVSRSIFTYSYIHGWIVLTTAPIGISAAFVAGYIRRKHPEGLT